MGHSTYANSFSADELSLSVFTKAGITNWLTNRSLQEASRDGGARRDRTDDLLLAKQALSQLSYGPVRYQQSTASNQSAEFGLLIPDYR